MPAAGAQPLPALLLRGAGGGDLRHLGLLGAGQGGRAPWPSPPVNWITVVAGAGTAGGGIGAGSQGDEGGGGEDDLAHGVSERVGRSARRREENMPSLSQADRPLCRVCVAAETCPVPL